MEEMEERKSFIWSPFAGTLDELPNEFEFPSELENLRNSGRPGKVICVIGGGLAGLTSAYELLGPYTATAHEVVLVDADKRLGGRIRTWHEGGVSGEFGAMRFPLNHDGTLHYVNELGLQTGVFVQSNLNAWCQVGNFKCRRSDFKALIDAYDATYGTSLNRFWLLRGNHPQASMNELLDKQLGTKFEFRGGKTVATAALDLTARAFDRVSLWQYLRDVDISPRIRKKTNEPYVLHTYRRPGRLWRPGMELFTDEEWELLSRASGERWEEGMSALENHVEAYAIRGVDERVRLVDGMDTLPAALEAKIEPNARIVLETPVTAVVQRGTGGRCMRVFGPEGEVTAADRGGFDYVVCAVPASAAARISFDPPLSRTKAVALTGLHCRNAAKSLVHVRRRIWERGERPIFGGASYTDKLIQQCWYPSDNVAALWGTDNDNNVYLEFTRGGVFGPVRPRYTAITKVAGDPDGWRQPAILTGAYMTGVNADRFISLSGAEKDDAVLSCLEDLHPGIHHDVLDIKHWAWMEQQAPGGGAWGYFEPGEHHRYQEALSEPHPHPSDGPKVFFAGEYLCPLHGWMQSAIHSSIKATLDVLRAP